MTTGSWALEKILIQEKRYGKGVEKQGEDVSAQQHKRVHYPLRRLSFQGSPAIREVLRRSGK